MPYSYIPGSGSGDPRRAMRLLLRFLLYLTLIGLLWKFVFKKGE